MTLMLIIIMTSVILLSVLINLTMLKTYYTVKEKKTIKESYYQIQKVFQKDTVRKNDVDEIAKTYNYRVLISDGSGTIVYSSEGEKSLMYKSLWNILNENLDKISNQIKKQGYAVMTNTNKSMGTSINLMGLSGWRLYSDHKYTDGKYPDKCQIIRTVYDVCWTDLDHLRRSCDVFIQPPVYKTN